MAQVVIGIDKLQRRLAALSSPAMRKGLMGRLALRSVAEMKRRIPRKTSTTSRSIHVGSFSERDAKILANIVALYLDQGTKPHEIVPRRRKALRWAARPEGRRLSGRPRTAAQRGELGGVVFAKRVHHPGTKAQPFIEESVRTAAAKSGLADAVVSAWNSAA